MQEYIHIPYDNNDPTLREIHVSNINWKFSVKSYALKATAVYGHFKEFFLLIQ